MPKRGLNNIVIENARIIFRNFRGEASKYNREGKKNFCVIIDDPNQAQAMAADGWNIRILQPREEGDEPRYYLPVEVNFNNIPPKVFLITSKAKTQLDDESIVSLDYAEIRNVDLTIRPYEWEIPTKDEIKSGVKAYVKNMYVTIEEDELAEKYADEEYPGEDAALPFH